MTRPFRRSRARHIVAAHAPARSHFSFTIAVFASRPGFLPRRATLGQALREIALWWRNRRPVSRAHARSAARSSFAEEIDEEWPKRNGPGRDVSMKGDLRALAEEYVALNGEIDDVRREMLACLTNGASESRPPYFSPAAGRASVAASQSAKAAKVDQQSSTCSKRRQD